MTTVCAWCGKILRVTTDHLDLVSHGICEKCHAKVNEDIKRRKT